MWRAGERDGIRVLTWVQAAGEGSSLDPGINDLDRLVGAAPDQRWILDLGALTLLTSRSIAQLIAVARRVSLAGGRIVLARPIATVAAVLRMTKLTRLLPMFDDLDQAARSLA
jgi:anti-anti-sigma factor